MTRAPTKMPQGLAIGMRIKTNKLYAKINPRSKRGEGTIVSASRGNNGPVLVHLDGHKYPHAMPLTFFEVVA
jgi:hypothetical protein